MNLFKSIELPVERFQCFLHRFSEFLFNGGEFAEGQNLSAAGAQKEAGPSIVQRKTFPAGQSHSRNSICQLHFRPFGISVEILEEHHAQAIFFCAMRFNIYCHIPRRDPIKIQFGQNPLRFQNTAENTRNRIFLKERPDKIHILLPEDLRLGINGPENSPRLVWVDFKI